MREWARRDRTDPAMGHRTHEVVLSLSFSYCKVSCTVYLAWHTLVPVLLTVLLSTPWPTPLYLSLHYSLLFHNPSPFLMPCLYTFISLFLSFCLFINYIMLTSLRSIAYDVSTTDTSVATDSFVFTVTYRSYCCFPSQLILLPHWPLIKNRSASCLI